MSSSVCILRHFRTRVGARITFAWLGAAFALAIGSAAPAAVITATWNGGAGNWNTAANWDIGLVPNNGVNTFDVLIDGGDAVASLVSLNTNATISNLMIDSGDELGINNANTLTVTTAGMGGSITNAGTIRLNSTTTSNTTLQVSGGDVMLDGGGSVVLGVTTSFNRIIPLTGSDRLINVDNVIHGRGLISADLVNSHQILANVAGTLTLDPVTVSTNTGTLRAAGGTLALSTGTWTNTGGLIDGLGSNVDLSGVTINGGTLSSSAGGSIRVIGADSTLNSVVNSGLFEITNGRTATFSGPLTNSGEIRLNSTTTSNTTLQVSGGDVMLDGGGSVVLGVTTGFNRIIPLTGSDRLINVDNVIRGRGTVSARLVNNHQVLANLPSATLLVSALPHENHGLFSALNGGTLSATSAVSGSGQWTADAGTIAVSAAAIVSGGQFLARNLGAIQVSGSARATAADVVVGESGPATLAMTTNGSFSIGTGTAVHIANTATLVSGGTLSGHGTITGNVANNAGLVQPGSSPGTLTVNGTYSQGASGTLRIEVAGPAPGTERDTLLVSGAATLAGTIAIDLQNGFGGATGDVLPFFSYASRTGAFTSVTGNVFGPGPNQFFAVAYAADHASLYVPLFGDANFDGMVSGADFTIWNDNFGTGTLWEEGDFNGDDLVTGADFTIWNDNFGQSVTLDPLVVPEPAAWILGALGAALVVGWRARLEAGYLRRP